MGKTTQTIRTVDLGYEQLFVFDAAPQGRVRVLYGAMWLTEEGEPGDSFVRAGDEAPLHGGRTVIEGLGPARVEIVAPRPSHRWLRVPQALRRFGCAARRFAARLHLGSSTAGQPQPCL